MSSLLAILLSAASIAAPGDHIRAGDAVLVPDIDIGMEYRTNVYRKDQNPVPGANLRVSPGLNLKVDNPMNAFNIGGEWELRKFFFVGDAGSGPVSASEQIQNLDQFNEVSLDANLDALKQEVVGIQLSNGAAVKNNLTDASLNSDAFNTRIRNQLSGGLRISPGPALAIIPGGTWVYDDYRATGSPDKRYNQRQSYGPTLQTTWDFFPRTSFVFRGDYLLYSWSENVVSDGVDPSLGGGTIELPNSRHLKFDTGLSGRFSNKLFLDTLFGYGFAVYDGADLADNLKGLDGFRTSLQLRYAVSENAQASLGYKRDFTDSFFTNWIAYDNLYALLQANVADFRPSAKFSGRFEEYAGGNQRNDLLLRFDLNAAYDIQTWASVSSGFGWQQRASSLNTVEYDDYQFRLFGTFKY